MKLMSAHRYPELDLLRSSAVLGMIIYHAAFDLVSFYGYHIDILHGPWLIFERIIAITFLLLVGISFAISYSRTPTEKIWPKFIKRGIIVLLCASLVSIVTYIIDPQTFVRFGVLHLIGVSILLLPFFVRLGLWNIAVAILMLILGHAFSTIHLPIFPYPDFPISLLLNLAPSDFTTVDYVPLLPWFSVILIGLVIGQLFYVKHLSWRTALPIPESRIPTLIKWPSRHALIIYLVHQPLIIAILWMIMGKPNF